MPKGIVLNVSTHAQDLADGRVLGPGEWGQADLNDDHNKHLIEAELVIKLDSEPKPPPPPAKETVEAEAPAAGGSA